MSHPSSPICILLLLLAHSSSLRSPSPPRLQEATAEIIRKGDRICLLGNALAERMQHDGWLETRLQERFPLHQLAFRNLGFSADELAIQQRTAGFGTWEDYLTRCRANLIFAFFGYNESFAGDAGLADFRKHLGEFITRFAEKDFGGFGPARLVLFSSIPHEDLKDPNLPDGHAHNARLAKYNGAMEEVARTRGVTYCDVFAPMLERYGLAKAPLTINGIHLTSEGNRVLAEVLEIALLGMPRALATTRNNVRESVVAKNLRWFNRYRATDGYNVYGGRSSLKYTDDVTNREVLQREMEILDAQCEEYDRLIWARAQGTERAWDASRIPKEMEVRTNMPGQGQDGAHVYVDGEEAIELMTPAPGCAVTLFADEKQFPALANPVQMAFDTRGRLWVSVWPTYPHWAPNQPMNDKLLVLEDKDGDGRADSCDAFADDLHNPTGFEFFGRGVVVANAPDLLYLEDTDGDGKADVRRRLLHGLSSADTHHSANSFVLGPDGALYFQEGTFHQSQVESIHGPVRNHNGCVWRFEPRTFRVERYVPYDFANPHGHVFDHWGQDFVTDGTGNQNYYALPFSGFVEHPDKHRGYFTFFKQASRPCAATEILSSSHFPEDHEGNYLVANVIGFRGIYQYRVFDSASGFKATQVDPLVFSADPNFRPADIEVGPDGAVYFLDWTNSIIGHMQHHLRDPSRDHDHGRVYRVTAIGRPLQSPVAIAGRPLGELMELLKRKEDRIRYRVRIELSGRKTRDVVAAVAAWVKDQGPEDSRVEHHLLEALWTLQQHNRVDEELLGRVLNSKDPRARAAATRVVRGLRHLLRDPLGLLALMAKDSDPRVRLEAVVAASFFRKTEAVAVALEAKRHPTDPFLDYALTETLRVLEPQWKAALTRGELIAPANPEALDYLLAAASPADLLGLPRLPKVLEAQLARHGIPMDARQAALDTLSTNDARKKAATLLSAIRSVDGSSSGHTRHVLQDLTTLLLENQRAGTTFARDELMALLEGGRNPETRQLAAAAIVAKDGGLTRLWDELLTRRDAFRSLLQAIPLIADPRHTKDAHERLHPLMFQLPEALAGTELRDRTQGLEVMFYRGTPKDASLETFQSLVPEASGHANAISLDLPEVLTRDEFGLMFRGSLHVQKAGDYTFFVRSDDGSRLYVDGTLVVENDGPHALRERSGKITLAAGPHAFLLTYYDQGGDDGLRVFWKAPDQKREPLPPQVLFTQHQDDVRAAAIRAVASLEGHEEVKFQDAARLIGEGLLIEPALELIERVPSSRWTAALAGPVIDSIAGHAAGLPKTQRTAPGVLAALELGQRLCEVLAPAERAATENRLKGLGGSTLLVRTVPHEMQYDRRELWVKTGQPVALIFQNNDVMPHNLVISKPSSLRAVGEAAETMAQAQDAQEKGFIPAHPAVLWHTPLILPGETARLTFEAPKTPGHYPYLCTFPGHWMIMNGVLHVVDELDENLLAANRKTPTVTAPSRRFVKMWAPKDLDSLLDGRWDANRSQAAGRRLFTEAGCTKCHYFGDQGIRSAPDLTKITEKYPSPKDLLRHILEPSASILEGFENYLIETKDGELIDGRIVEDLPDTLVLGLSIQEPDKVRRIKKSDILDRTKMSTSSMPTGLLVTLTEAEILDLLAYLRAPPNPR